MVHCTQLCSIKYSQLKDKSGALRSVESRYYYNFELAYIVNVGGDKQYTVARMVFPEPTCLTPS